MALSQQEYQDYVARMEKLGLTPDPSVQPVKAPVQAPVQAPQAQPTVPTPPASSYMEQFKQDYGQVQQVMRDTDPTAGLSSQLVEVLPDVGEMGGAMAGMYYGAKQGGTLTKNPYGVALGGLFGGMLGAGSGESLKQMFNSEFDPAKVINTMLVSGMFTGAFEGVGKALEMAANGMSKLRAGKPLSMDEIASMDQLVKEAEKAGITITPAQLTGSNLQRTLEKVGKAGFGGEQQFVDLYVAQDQFMADRLQALIKQTGNPNRKQTGEMFQQALEDANANLMTWAEPKYAALSKAAKGEPISLQGTQQSLRHKLALSNQGRRQGAKGTVDPEVEELYQYVLGNVQNTDFKQWFELIKRLNADHRKVLNRSIENKSPSLEKAYADVFNLLYKDADRAAQKYGTDVLKQFRDVSDIVRESKRTINDSAIRSAVTAQPEYAGAKIFQEGNVSSVEAAFKAIDEAAVNAARVGKEFDAEQIKNNLRAGYLEELFKKTELDETTSESAYKLLNKLGRDPYSRDTFAAMMPPKAQAEIKRVLGWGGMLERNSAGNFSLIVRGRQSGELNRLANQVTGNDTAGFTTIATTKALATVLAPFQLAKRAVNGKATNKALGELKDIVLRFDQGKLQTSDVATLLGLWATDVTEEETLPLELRVPDLSNRESLEYHQARAKAIANLEEAGNVIPDNLLMPSFQAEAPVSASPNTPLQVEVTQGQQ